MRRTCLAWIAFALLLFVGPVAFPTSPDAGQDREALMKEKLELAQKVLAGLSKNDLAAVAADADSLAALTRETRWRITEAPEYLSRSVEFERNASTLAAMAGGKNAEGAALAWVQVTTQCLDCHRWTRDARKPR